MLGGKSGAIALIGFFTMIGQATSTGIAQDKLPGKKGEPGVELLPQPRPADQGLPATPLVPPPGGWVGPDGALWMFDGLRWKVQWENGKWYPVIPPGPLPGWKMADFGMGWKGVLPPNTSIWHVVPPSFALMPPPSALPPLPPPPSHRASYRGRRGHW